MAGEMTQQNSNAAVAAPAPGANGAASPAAAPASNVGSTSTGAEPSVPATSAAMGTQAPAAQPAGAPALELKLPEGFAPDEKVLGELRAVAGELKLDNGGAQKLVDFLARSQQAATAAAVARAEAIRAQWAQALKTDKELSAEGFGAAARQAMAKWGTPALAQFFEETGLGDHPELIRFFGRIGKLAAEDTLAGTGGGAPSGSSSDEAFLRQMYDHPTSQRLFGRKE